MWRSACFVQLRSPNAVALQLSLLLSATWYVLHVYCCARTTTGDLFPPLKAAALPQCSAAAGCGCWADELRRATLAGHTGCR